MQNWNNHGIFIFWGSASEFLDAFLDYIFTKPSAGIFKLRQGASIVIRVVYFAFYEKQTKSVWIHEKKGNLPNLC